LRKKTEKRPKIPAAFQK